MLGQERLARFPCTFPSPVFFRFSGFRTLALLPTEGPEPCRLLEQGTYMSHCGFCVSEGNVCVSRYPSPQFVQTGFTDHSSRLSVNPTVCDQKTGVLVRACRTLKILPLSLLGQHMDGAAPSATPTLRFVPAAPPLASTPSPWPTWLVLPPFSMLEAFAWPSTAHPVLELTVTGSRGCYLVCQFTVSCCHPTLR